MNGTHLYYNRVLFRDCETLEFNSIIEYDERNHQTKFMRTRVTVASTLVSIAGESPSTKQTESQQHGSTIQIPPIANNLETIVDRWEEIQQLLSEPGKDFWFAINATTNSPPATVGNQIIPKESGNSSYRLILVATGLVPTNTSSGQPGHVGNYVRLFDTDLTVERKNVFDANSGPKPMNVKVGQILGGHAMRIEATFEICRVLSKNEADVDPEYDAQHARGIINHVWRATDSSDDDGAVSHSISGKIRVKDQRYKPNAMRTFAFPLAFPFARIVRRRYGTDSAGLELEYEFEIKQEGAAPPPGIRKYSATYSEGIRVGGKPPAFGRMRIDVWGWYDRSNRVNNQLVHSTEKQQKLLMLRAMHTILWSRIRGLNKNWTFQPGQNAPRVLLQSAVITEQVGVPKLSLDVEVMYADGNKTEFHTRIQNLGEPFSLIPAGENQVEPYDPRWWPIDNEWGRIPDTDSANPNFHHDIYPFSGDGSPGESDYFTGYFHSPANDRQSLPRITGRTLRPFDTEDTSKEWARPGGSVPDDATDNDQNAVQAVTPNPITIYEISATPTRDLGGNIVMGDLAVRENEANSKIADVQAGPYPFLQWTSAVKSDTDQGIVVLPLSAPRQVSAARIAAMGLPSGTQLYETCVAGQLCAPISYRVYSLTVSRVGAPPIIPAPHPLIKRFEGGPNNSQVVRCIERLTNKELLGCTPKLMPDGVNVIYEASVRYTYCLSTPWNGANTENQWNGATGQYPADWNEGNHQQIPFGYDPTVELTAAQNTIDLYGQELSLFGPQNGSNIYG